MEHESSRSAMAYSWHCEIVGFVAAVAKRAAR